MGYFHSLGKVVIKAWNLHKSNMHVLSGTKNELFSKGNQLKDIKATILKGTI